jgi:hypothetical protein
VLGVDDGEVVAGVTDRLDDPGRAGDGEGADEDVAVGECLLEVDHAAGLPGPDDEMVEPAGERRVRRRSP